MNKAAQILFKTYLTFQIFVALAVIGWIGMAAETNALRPNVVLIMADDLGYSDIGCFGAEIATPNLDRMAANGMRMTQFYNTPRCCPTRAALLTGLYPQQAGIGGMMEDRGIPGYRGELNHHCITIAEQLRQANYHALMVGKWHISHIYFDGKRQLNHETDEAFWDTKDSWPVQRGFEEYYGAIHGVTSYYDPFSLVRDNTPIKQVATNFYYTDAITEQASAYITKYAGGNQPFFLYVAYSAPHWPLQAPDADIARHRSAYDIGWDAIRTNRYHRQIELGIVDKSWPLSPRDPRVPAWEEVKDKKWEANRMATYAAMVARMDTGIGRILETLKKTGVETNTLVLFFSDNGACEEVIHPAWYDVPSRTRDGRPVKVGNQDHSVTAGPDDVWQSYGLPWANVSDTPFRLYKHFTHEGGISSPFIACWPGVISKDAISRQVGHIIDIMPTCVELAGAHHPETFKGQTIQPLEGTSLLPVLLGNQRTNSNPLFWEHEGNRAVRWGKWKLVSRHPGNWELYDVVADRTELHNLAAELPNKAKEMSDLYDAWAKRCNVVPPDSLPPKRPTFPAGVHGKQTGVADD